MDRILVLLKTDTANAALDMLRSASACADAHDLLSFGIAVSASPDEASLSELRRLGNVQYAIATDTPFSALWQGEPFVLLASSSLRFSAHWDRSLRTMWEKLREQHVDQPVLTGIPPAFGAYVDAMSPAGVAEISSEQIVFRRGLPCLRASEPQRAAWPVPGFLYAPSAFFRQCLSSQEPLYLSAFRAHWEFYTPNRTVARAAQDLTPSPEPLREEERFFARFGIDPKAGTFTAQAHSGLFTQDLCFETRTDKTVRLLRHILPTRPEKLSLLCVTTVLENSAPADLFPEEQQAAFRHLAEQKNLNLLCYADRGSMQSVLLKHPNVLEYDASYGLPVHPLPVPAETRRARQLGKMFLLAQACHRFPGHSHLCWLSPYLVDYPADPETQPDLTRFCTDRIVLGCINGTPDPDMIIVPQSLLAPLCGEITGLCGNDSRRFVSLPEEREVWQTLLRTHPDRFTAVEISRPHDLMALLLRIRTPEMEASV